VTLRSFPGERAKIVGRLYVPRGSDHVTIADLDLDGTNASHLPSPTVNAQDTVFRGNDVTNNRTGICFVLGHETWGRAVRTVIEGNRVHDCGRLPATNYDHGIYVSVASDVVIRGNVIYDNADRGVQLYPDAQRTIVEGNVLDGNGQNLIFSGAGGVSSNGNLVRNNVITNSRVRYNVESYYPSGTPAGTGNVLSGNCVHGGARAGETGGVMDPHGYTATGNLVIDPQYVDRAAKDFRLRTGSPCAAVLAGMLLTEVASGGSTQPVPTASAPAPEPVPAPAPEPVPAPAPEPVVTEPVVTEPVGNTKPARKSRLRTSSSSTSTAARAKPACRRIRVTTGRGTARKTTVRCAVSRSSSCRRVKVRGKVRCAVGTRLASARAKGVSRS
jgi:parallel beta-helix repeat protein